MPHSFASFSLFVFPIILVLGSWLQAKQVNNYAKKQHILSRLSGVLIASGLVVSIAYINNSDQFVGNWLSLSPAKLVMLILVIFMAMTLIKFSVRYIQTETDVDTYWRWLLLSLASVSIVILSNHLLLFWFGWVSISLCFHRLLLFYPNRSRAVLAAHKKFIIARFAELLLLIAFLTLFWAHDTFQISALAEYYVDLNNIGGSLTVSDKFAAILIAITALIKCAQLPVHGWLIQVVEAPTPISALLHAGIINLGGFLLFSFSSLISLAVTAQWLILIVAGVSLFVTSLVMMTRISLKVRLAWSTSAQMGLMLIECALGLYEVALLHLVTHSLYKAHAFLNSGDALHNYYVRQLSDKKTFRILPAIIALLISLVSVIAVSVSVDVSGPISMWFLITLALSMYIITAINVTNMRGGFIALVSAMMLLGFYWTGKAIIAQLIPDTIVVQGLSAMDIWVMSVFVALFLTSELLRAFPDLALSKTLSRWFYAGLYLDESMTRLTLLVWPVRLRANSDTEHNTPH